MSGTDQFLVTYQSWRKWRAANPGEYDRYERTCRLVAEGGKHLVEGQPRSQLIRPWPHIWDFTQRAIKRGYDPLQVMAALTWVVEHQAEFWALDNAYGWLTRVMDNYKARAGEERWEGIKQRDRQQLRFAPNLSTLTDSVNGLLENARLKRELNEARSEIKRLRGEEDSGDQNATGQPG